jgi:hypothetical protein
MIPHFFHACLVVVVLGIRIEVDDMIYRTESGCTVRLFAAKPCSCNQYYYPASQCLLPWNVYHRFWDSMVRTARQIRSSPDLVQLSHEVIMPRVYVSRHAG